MKIKNLTDKVQWIHIVEYFTKKGYDICVGANDTYTAPVGYHIADEIKIKSGIFAIVGETPVELPKDIEESNDDLNSEEGETSEGDDFHEEGEDDEDNSLDETEGDEDTTIDDNPVDKFVCEICGSEFASARSLNTHKSRMHPDSL